MTIENDQQINLVGEFAGVRASARLWIELIAEQESQKLEAEQLLSHGVAIVGESMIGRLNSILERVTDSLIDSRANLAECGRRIIRLSPQIDATLNRSDAMGMLSECTHDAAFSGGFGEWIFPLGLESGEDKPLYKAIQANLAEIFEHRKLAA